MKHFFLFFCICLTLTVCVTAQPSQISYAYAVIPETVRPGEPVTIGAAGGVKQALLHVNGRQLTKAAFFPIPAADGKPGFMAAVLTVPTTASPGPAVIILEDENGVIDEIPLTIMDRHFNSETIALNQALTGIRRDASPQRAAEVERLWAILTTTGTEVYHTGAFVQPVLSNRRTSFFGDRRVFRYSNNATDTSIHFGVDYGIPTGTRVIACGSGRVVLAVMRIVTGNTIVIEHAPGIYSLYYHLDKIEVEEGAMVNTGTMLGFSGVTGLATGPHLHWEIRVNGEPTDIDSFLTRPILDKDLIISKIYH